MVSLVGQLAKLRLGPTEKLDDYFVRSQELMTRLSDAGERVSDTLFNALVISRLPEQYEHFVVQESFQPATTFHALRTSLRNCEDAKRARQEEQQTGNHVAMHGLRKGNSRDTNKTGAGHKAHTKKGIDHITCYRCKKKGHYQRDCKERESSSSAKTFSASRSGWKLESSSVVDSGCTDHVVYDRSLPTTFEASNTGEGVVNPNGSLADVKGKGTVEASITDVNGIERMYKFHDVFFVPSYHVNLMCVVSVGRRRRATLSSSRVINRSINVVKTSLADVSSGSALLSSMQYQWPASSTLSEGDKGCNALAQTDGAPKFQRCQEEAL